MKLKVAPGRLKALPNRLGFAASPEDRDKLRYRNEPWRKWYNTNRWKAAKQRVHIRDGYICQQSGVMLVGVNEAPNSPVAHHIIPHKGDPVLFWDEDNIQSVSKLWHDTEGQSQEKSFTD